MTITAKYPGRCRRCRGHIEAGSEVEWTKGRGVAHVGECPQREMIEREPQDDLTPDRAIVARAEFEGQEFSIPAGEMLFDGRLHASVRRPDGQHVTLFMRAMERDDTEGRWVQREFPEASHLFIRAGVDFYESKVATYYPADGTFRPARGADPDRVKAAEQLLRYLAGKGELEGELFVATECCRCGTELTDPESVTRGIGPVCVRKRTESRHIADNGAAAKERARKVIAEAEANGFVREPTLGGEAGYEAHLTEDAQEARDWLKQADREEADLDPDLGGSMGGSLGFDPELPAGFQDADIEAAEYRMQAMEAAGDRAQTEREERAKHEARKAMER